MLISIIVPVYNAESFLSRCIESVIGQSYTKIELILVDDGSTDKSKAICNQYALTDKRVKVFSQENQGPAAARNAGVEYAQGEYIFFLDADDFIDKNSIDILCVAAKQYQPDLIMGNFSKLENDGQVISQKISFKINTEPFTGHLMRLSQTDIGNYLRHFLKHPSNHLISYCWARLYKTSIIKDNKISAHEKMRLFEDLIFNLEYLKHSQTTMFVNQSIYNYVMHNSHISASMALFAADSLLNDMAIFHQEVGEFLKNHPLEPTKMKHAGSTNNHPSTSIEQMIGHALIHYAIIFIVRACRQVNQGKRKLIHSEISKLINAPLLQSSLDHYRPTKGNSRLLPLLMRTRQIHLIILLSNYKARRRYGELQENRS